MSLKGRLKRLEESGLLGNKVMLGDGSTLECKPGEILEVIIAASQAEEHRLLPALERAQGELGELLRALRGEGGGTGYEDL